MQLTVKTLKGGKFTIDVEPSNTVAEAKAIIVSVCVSVIIILYFNANEMIIHETNNHHVICSLIMTISTMTNKILK